MTRWHNYRSCITGGGCLKRGGIIGAAITAGTEELNASLEQSRRDDAYHRMSLALQTKGLIQVAMFYDPDDDDLSKFDTWGAVRLLACLLLLFGIAFMAMRMMFT
jgi:hypothetical protein